MWRYSVDSLKPLIRHIPDYPKPGILFYDITTLLSDAKGLHAAIDCLVNPYRNDTVDCVIGIESRGFIFGTAVADRLGLGFIPVRKAGKLPSTTVSVDYELEYGTDSLEMHDDAIRKGQHVLIVDDLLATGGTAKAVVDLVVGIGANVHGLAFLIELEELKGRSKLMGQQVFSVMRY